MAGDCWSNVSARGAGSAAAGPATGPLLRRLGERRFAPNAVGLALGAGLVGLVPYQPLSLLLGLTRLVTVVPVRGRPRSSPRP
jgi:hypothetical protein